MACEVTLGGEASESIATTACALPFEQIGPYRVLRVIAAGGMGTVYEGLRTDIDRRVAIKVLHADIGGRPDAQARLYREASAVNRVGHPGLAEVSEVEPLPGGGLYLVMEFLRGETLAARLARCGGRLAIVDLLELGIRLADILTVAHRHGVIHRDIKPSNVMLVPDPQMPSGERVKLIDFGIAKLATASTVENDPTPRDTVLGTPAYMSPEQCSGTTHIDGKSDVYALGALLFHLAAGRPPFVAATPRLVMARHQLESPPALSSLCPQAPNSIVALVAAMLGKEPTLRPAMDDVLKVLRGIAADALAQPNIPALPVREPTRTELPRTLDDGPAKRSRTSLRWGRWLLALVTLLLSGILGAIYGWLRTASSPPLAATQRPLTSVASSRPMKSARNPAQNPASQQEAAALSTTPAATPIVKPPASQSAPAKAALPTRSHASSPTVRGDARPSPTAPASAPISPSPPKGPAPPPATQEEIDDPEKFLPL